VLTLLEGIEGLGGHAPDRVYLKCSMKLQGGGPPPGPRAELGLVQRGAVLCGATYEVGQATGVAYPAYRYLKLERGDPFEVLS